MLDLADVMVPSITALSLAPRLELGVVRCSSDIEGFSLIDLAPSL
jgi:hypothetical protein